MKLLEINDLAVSFKTKAGLVRAVDGVSLSLANGQCLGLVGESGCGKTTLAKAILSILPPNAVRERGQIAFAGKDLCAIGEGDLRKIKWKDISVIPQSAMASLDPVRRVDEQILEAIRIHTDGGWDEKQALARVAELFEMVGIDRRRMREYPHQFSGGMKQRAMIAMALALNPRLIIADEPTTSLDVIVQDQILRRLSEIRASVQAAMLLVTHDIGVVAENCNLVAVMYAGKLLEFGPTGDVLARPLNPYTMGLVNAFPSLLGGTKGLVSIPGSPPDLIQPPAGCRFQPRCPFKTSECCEQEPALVEGEPGHFVSCHRFGEAESNRAAAVRREIWGDAAGLDGQTWQGFAWAKDRSVTSSTPKLLQVNGLKTWFQVRKGLVSAVLGRGDAQFVRAVDGVSFDLAQGEILGLAGESGCGKSTTGLSIAKLYNPTGGEVLFDGRNWKDGNGKDFHRAVQIIFQDPYGSLNPRRSVLDIVEKPLLVHRIGTDRAERMKMIGEALALAGLTPPESYYSKFPHQLSGGQRQRVAIARAMVLRPRVLVADEPVSMLDVSVRIGVLNVLRHLSEELGVAILYISHDLSTMRYICHRTAVMYLGRIVEIGLTHEVIDNPLHPYTEALMSAIPVPEVSERRERRHLTGEAPNPIDLPSGCRFGPRCPQADARCRQSEPELVQLEPGRQVACFKWMEAHE